MHPQFEAKVRTILDQYSKLQASSIADAAKQLGIPRKTLSNYVNDHALKLGLQVEKRQAPGLAYSPPIVTEYHSIPEMPDDDLPVEEIIQMRKREFEQKKAYEEASKLIPVQIKIDGPIGILHFGDPHLDDDGTDIGEVFRQSELTRTVEGLFGANCGDITNNWVGRLARLYGEQNMGRRRSIRVAEHFVKQTRWLWMVGGNHDAWSGHDDPLHWIAMQASALYRASEARLELNFPKGSPFVVNARHDFAGGSMWNPAHGAMKAIQLGIRDDLLTCGHKHISGYGIIKDPDTGKICQALQIGSFKIFDRYQKEKNLRDQMISPSALTVIDPLKAPSNPDRCKVFWDPDEGVDYLKFKRRTIVR